MKCVSLLPCVGHIKHAELIANCYPTKEGETAPLSSELSYLIFYVRTRPAKLTKVGTFLQNKVNRDIAKGRKQSNTVSLRILDALIESSHHDLNLFSKYIVKILNVMLDTRDFDLVRLSCETFIIFSGYHDGSTLDIDTDFTNDYENLVSKFASFCNYSNAEDDVAIRMRYIGHCAILAVVTSPAFVQSYCRFQRDLALPAVMRTLLLSDKPALELLPSEPCDLRSLITTNDNVDIIGIERLSAQSLGAILINSNAASARLSIDLIFMLLTEASKWWPPERYISIMQLALTVLHPQHHYILVTEVLQLLDPESSIHPEFINAKHACLIFILSAILNTEKPLVGISVLEILNILFNILIKTVQACGYHENPSAQDDANASFVSIIQQGIISSIGSLASQTYYQNQLNHMTGYLVSKLRASTTLDKVDDMDIHLYRHVTLKCLSRIVQGKDTTSTDIDSGNDEESLKDVVSAAVSFRSWTAALSLLADQQSAETRYEFTKTLLLYFKASIKNRSTPLTAHPELLLSLHSDIEFVNTAYRTIVEWVQVEDLRVFDAQGMYHILCALTRCFGVDAVVRAVPLVFKLQDMIRENTILGAPKQRAIVAIVLAWFSLVGDLYTIESLCKYTAALQEKHRDTQQGSGVLDEASNPWCPLSQFESDNGTAMVDYIDRQTVVECISSEDTFQSTEGVRYADLENRLNVEWDSEAFRNAERTFSIRSSDSFERHKPKLVSPFPLNDLIDDVPELKQSIRVENLKMALVTHSTANQEGTGTPVSGINIPGTPASNQSVSHSPSLTEQVDTLLAELKFDPKSLETNHSLANPPYQ